MTGLPDDVLIGDKARLLRDPSITAWAPTRDGGWEPDAGGVPGQEGRLAPDDPALRAGLRREAVSNLIAQWAVTSNGTAPRALAIQQAAAEEFGLVGAAEWETDPGLRAEVEKEARTNGQLYRAFLRAQYDETQAAFASRGITHVRLHRGFTWDDDADSARRAAPGWAAADDGDRPVPLRPMSSFSTSERVAAEFAAGKLGGTDRHRTVIEATVPVSRILSTPRTGTGCLPEQEMVVLSGPGRFVVRTARSGEWGAGIDPPDDDLVFGFDDEDIEP
jgi:hypothetical protein